MINQCIKFVVSRFIYIYRYEVRYEDINGGAKCRKLGWFGVVRGHSWSWAMPPFDRAHTTSYSTLIETVCFYRFRDIAGYLSKVADFDLPHLHSAPSYGVTPVEFRGDLWLQKSGIPGISCGVVYVILRLAVLVELRLVTDRQTDRHRHRPIASTAHA